MAARTPFVKVYVATALLLSALVSGCTSSSKEGVDGSTTDDLGLDAAPPVLYLNLTIGNDTHRFSTLKAGGDNATGNGTTSATATVSSSNATATGNATAGNSTAGGNATGGDSGNGEPGGEAPLNVSATLGASGLAGRSVSWTLDFGDAAKAGNATGHATSGGNSTAGNSTAGNGTSAKASGPTNGTKVPATVEHTYTEAGTYSVSLSFQIANGTKQVLRATLTVTAPAGNMTNTTAYGPLPEPIVIEGSATGVFGVIGAVDETFELTTAVALMTITLDFDEVACLEVCVNDLDWSIAGPGGESDGGANFGPEDPVEFEAPTLGTWTVTVEPFNTAGPASYTITVTFA